MLTPTTTSAVLVLGAHDIVSAGAAALALHGVARVTADRGRGQVHVRYNPREVEADSILRAMRPGLDDDASHVHYLLSAWPTLAKALPVAAALL